MTEPDDSSTSLFNPGKAQWLREKGDKKLSSEQQALILAMAQLETELGRQLSEEEQGALTALASQLKGFDANAITDAVRQMVTKPTDPERKTAWPELKRHK